MYIELFKMISYLLFLLLFLLESSPDEDNGNKEEYGDNRDGDGQDLQLLVLESNRSA